MPMSSLIGMSREFPLTALTLRPAGFVNVTGLDSTMKMMCRRVVGHHCLEMTESSPPAFGIARPKPAGQDVPTLNNCSRAMKLAEEAPAPSQKQALQND
jgi:hypothetical protein